MFRDAVAFALLVAMPAVASASEAPIGVAFAGGATGSGTSGYAGVLYALPGGQLGRGVAIRASVNAGRYHYDSAGQRINASYAGGEAAFVYQFSGPWGWANFSAGPRVTDTRLSPADPANDRVGTRVDAAVQSDGAYWVAPSVRLDWLASYALRDMAYFSRIGVGPVVDKGTGTRIGLEAGIQGDARYSDLQAGLFAATRLGRDLDGQVAIGLADQERLRVHPYVSIGASLLF